ncbi:MAG: class I SAM-dependent methyltransferase [Patescibacteria group bacterium]
MKDKTKLTASVYDEISVSYADKFNEPSDNIDDFLKLIKKGGKILDAGCGPGVDVAYIISKDFDVIGVDISERILEIARKKNPKVHFKKADIRKLNFKPNTFDGIIASFSLIHIPKKDIDKTVGNFYKLLKPKGVIYIGIQEGDSQEVLLAEPLKPDEKIFLNIMSSKEIKEILNKIGFSILVEFSRRAESKEEFGFNKFVVIAKK